MARLEDLALEEDLAVETAAEGCATRPACAGPRRASVDAGSTPVERPANEFAPEWRAATKSACADSDATSDRKLPLDAGVGERPVSPVAPPLVSCPCVRRDVLRTPSVS